MVRGVSEFDSEDEITDEIKNFKKILPGSLKSLSPSSSQSPTTFPESNWMTPQLVSPVIESYTEFRYSLPLVPRTVPCIVLSSKIDGCTQRTPLLQVPGIDSPLDSIMAKISKLSTTISPQILPGNLNWRQSESYHEDNLRESVELYDSMKQIVKEPEVRSDESGQPKHGENTENCNHSSKDENIDHSKLPTVPGKLSFGIDRILAEDSADAGKKDEPKAFSKLLPGIHSDIHPKYLNHCSDCYLVSRFCYKYSPSQRSPTSALCQSSPNCSSAIWNTIPHFYEPNANFHPQNGGYRNPQLGAFALNTPSGYSGISSIVGCNNNTNGRRKRSWSRAVFSNLQRKGLEKRFQIQKYITKPDRRQLAATLGLTDAQVKVWFQNRRMKWRHTKEGKSGDSGTDQISTTPISAAHS